MGVATIWLVGKSGECMSQTETLMLVLLGFAAASFLALVIGRSLWKLARAIHRRRHEHELPATVAALKADREDKAAANIPIFVCINPRADIFHASAETGEILAEHHSLACAGPKPVIEIIED